MVIFSKCGNEHSTAFKITVVIFFCVHACVLIVMSLLLMMILIMFSAASLYICKGNGAV